MRYRIKNKRICCLCGKDLTYKFGNNPDPLGNINDECCRICDYTKVIPARIKQSQQEQQKT